MALPCVTTVETVGPVRHTSLELEVKNYSSCLSPPASDRARLNICEQLGGGAEREGPEGYGELLRKFTNEHYVLGYEYWDPTAFPYCYSFKQCIRLRGDLNKYRSDLVHGYNGCLMSVR